MGRGRSNGYQKVPNPTEYLPPIQTVRNQSNSEIYDSISEWLDYIIKIYFPLSLDRSLERNRPVWRTLHRVEADVIDSGYASTDDAFVAAHKTSQPNQTQVDDNHDLLEDPFEREYTIQWLMRLMRFATECSDGGDNCKNQTIGWSEIVESTSSLLAKFSAPADTEDESNLALTRVFAFRKPDRSMVEVILNDEPLLDDDHTSVGLQSWGSAIVLGSMLCAGLLDVTLTDMHRILELGAGTGLLSVIFAKLLPDAKVVATDYHPDVLLNLSSNIGANFPDQLGCPVQVHPLDWESYMPPNKSAQTTFEITFSDKFDTIVAADVVYSAVHASWIYATVFRLLRQTQDATFLLIAPKRQVGRHAAMVSTVDTAFAASAGSDPTLVIRERMDIPRDKGVKMVGANVGRADEEGWVYWRIGWSL